MKHLSSAILALVTCTLAACGHAGPMAPVAMKTSGLRALASGHKLGYDLDRFRTVVDKQEKAQTMPRQGMLPTRTDLRAKCPPVYDQGDLGACTGFAIAKGFRETLQLQRGGAAVPMSALYLYYQERAAFGKVSEDTGATIADGMKVLAKSGCAPDVYWPYVEAKFAIKPPAQAMSEAGKWKVRSTTRLASLADVKAALAKGQTVPLGFEVYPSFDKIGGNGVMPMPAASEKLEGGHAALAVGYDDGRKVLIVRNSWGKGWGDDGYFYMPYAFAQDRKRVDEFWTAE